MIVIFLGSPGTGKGTIAKQLVKDYGFLHLSTGDIMRETIKSQSELGKTLDKIIASGNLVNDDITNEVLVENIKKYDLNNDKIILDGYPRTLNQAEFLDTFLRSINSSVSKVLYFDGDKTTLIKRLSGRLICKSCGQSYHVEFLKPKQEGICDVCGGVLYQRPDDSIDKIEVRLNSYENLTKPLINYYLDKKILTEIDISVEENNNIKVILEKMR